MKEFQLPIKYNWELAHKPIADKPIAERPYKVYTALLTQNGGDNPLIIYEGDLTIGVTYSIDATLGPEYDFSNVGGPKYPENFPFVATGTTPNNWGAELLYNTGAPVVTVLENTIGNVWFTYESTGLYSINTDNLIFLTENTFAPTVTVSDGGSPILYAFSTNVPFDGKLFIYGDEGYLNNTPIEIRVYN